MGSRINFVFQDTADGPAVVLYSHWGADSWRQDLAHALNHASPRWDGGLEDTSYATRMMISYLIKDFVMDEIGYGLFAISDASENLGDETVIINLPEHNVYEGEESTSFKNFIHNNREPVSPS